MNNKIDVYLKDILPKLKWFFIEPNNDIFLPPDEYLIYKDGKWKIDYDYYDYCRKEGRKFCYETPLEVSREKKLKKGKY